MATGSATPFICLKLIITPINVTMTRSSNNTSHHALSVHPLPGPKGTDLGKASSCLHGPRGLVGGETGELSGHSKVGERLG